MASKTVITVMISISISRPPSYKRPLSNKRPYECVFVNKRPHSAKLPYSNIILEYGYVTSEVHLPLIAHKRTVMPHYKKSGLVCVWVHKFFKRMISSPNFVGIARLVVLARKDPGTTSPFSSLLDLHFVLTAGFLRKVNIRKESYIGTPASAHAQKGCYQLQGKSLTITEHSPQYLLLLQFLLLFVFK